MLFVFYEFLLCFKILFLRFTHIVHVTLIHSSLVFHRSPLLEKPQSGCIFLLLKDICGHSVYLFYYHLKVVTNLLPYLVLLIITHFRISLSSFKKNLLWKFDCNSTQSESIQKWNCYDSVRGSTLTETAHPGQALQQPFA